MTDLRPIKLFLTDAGVITVSTTVPASRTVVCDCGHTSRRTECPHILWVKSQMRGHDLLPVRFTKEVTAEDLQALLDGPLPEYRKFFSRYAHIEVM